MYLLKGNNLLYFFYNNKSKRNKIKKSGKSLIHLVPLISVFGGSLYTPPEITNLLKTNNNDFNCQLIVDISGKTHFHLLSSRSNNVSS